MKQNTKYIFLLLVLFLLTGCNLKYDLLIKDDGTVSENLYINKSNSEILENNDDVNAYLDEIVAPYQSSYPNYNYYKHKGLFDSYALVNRDYDNLTSYVTASNMFKTLFEGANVTGSEVKVFRTVGHFYYDELYGNNDIDPTAYLDGIAINIRFYNNVIESNADNYDSFTNTYTWIVDESTMTKDIYFKTNSTINYTAKIYQFILDNLTAVVFISSILLIVIVALLIIKIKKSENNKL